MTSFESVLRSREAAGKGLFPYSLKFPVELSNDEIDVMERWLEANCDGKFRVRRVHDWYFFRFADNADLIQFSMVWL